MFAWMRKGYGNLDGCSFGQGLYMPHLAQLLTELMHPANETGCDLASPGQLCGSSCKQPLTASLVVLFCMALSFAACVILLAFPKTPDRITILFFFGVLADCLFWKRKYIIPLFPINYYY